MSTVLSPPFLFRFATPIRYRSKIWSDRSLAFGEEFRLQSFGHLEGKRQFADVRAAWNERGIAFSINVTGKRQAAWCRESRAVESDGLQVWIDTRATNNVHRATKFCHRYVFLPTGGGHSLREPAADQLLINRARENAKPIRPGELRIRSLMKADGYTLECCVPATALTGYDPSEYDRIGFYYAVMDRELGWQNYSVGTQFPFDEDPSTWGICELVRD